MQSDESLNVLILDDDDSYRSLTAAMLMKEYTVFTAESPSIAFSILGERQIDILICDYRLPEMNGIEVLQKVKAMDNSVEVIMISSYTNMDTVIEAMRFGAIDFFKKPFEFEDIKIAFERTKKYVRLQSQLRGVELGKKALANELKQNMGVEIISKSAPMEAIKEIMVKVAKTEDTSVMITGESGTGKELIARGIHYLSSRKDEYFGAVNMSAVPDSLLESEFFGHRKGSFTGAVSDRAGWFEISNKGTLFLDEIGDMPPQQQVKLLRVLEDRKFIKVGSQKEIGFDIRIISATNKKASNLSSGKEFRPDLYHRLSTFEIYIPPLRERPEDVEPLLMYYTQTLAAKMKKGIKGIQPNAIERLSQYNFPGNVRELKNLVERAVILCDDDMLSLEHFPQVTAGVQQVNMAAEVYDLELIERTTILKALKKAENNKAKAAELLNIKWNALHRRLQKYGIDMELED